MATTNPASMSRRAFTGSCHCGSTKYVAYLSFPPVVTSREGPRNDMLIYKCNCSSCLKMGVFHLRLKSSPDDFMLLSPSDPDSGQLGDYQCFSKRLHWYFCKNCGVRCFTFMGTGETVEVGVDSLPGSHEGGSGKAVKVWRPKKEGWVEGGPGRNSYLSVNAITLDQGQEGLDLREWTEKKWIWYLDCKDNKEDRLERDREDLADNILLSGDAYGCCGG